MTYFPHKTRSGNSERSAIIGGLWAVAISLPVWILLYLYLV